MLNIGPQEVLLILIVALVVVGPQRLPELSRSIGKALRSLRAAQDEMRRTVSDVLEPEGVRDTAKEIRRTGKEIRESLRLDAPPARRTPSRQAKAPEEGPENGTAAEPLPPEEGPVPQ